MTDRNEPFSPPPVSSQNTGNETEIKPLPSGSRPSEGSGADQAAPLPKKGKRRPGFLSAVLLGALILCGIGLFFVFKSPDHLRRPPLQAPKTSGMTEQFAELQNQNKAQAAKIEDLTKQLAALTASKALLKTSEPTEKNLSVPKDTAKSPVTKPAETKNTATASEALSGVSQAQLALLTAKLSETDAALASLKINLQQQLNTLSQKYAALHQTLAENQGLSDLLILSRKTETGGTLTLTPALAALLPPDIAPQLSALNGKTVLSLKALQQSFVSQAARVLNEPLSASSADQSFFAGIENNFKSLITVEKGNQVILGNPNHAVLSRASAALAASDLSAAVAILQNLSPSAKNLFTAWLNEAQTRLTAEKLLQQALEEIHA